jgi:hypothetical protein
MSDVVGGRRVRREVIRDQHGREVKVWFVEGTDKGMDGEPNLCDDTQAYRSERDPETGEIVERFVPVSQPPLRFERCYRGLMMVARGLPAWATQQSRNREPRRQSTTRTTRRSTTRTSRGDPDSDGSEPPLRVVSLARFRRDVAAWLEAVGKAPKVAK